MRRASLRSLAQPWALAALVATVGCSSKSSNEPLGDASVKGEAGHSSATSSSGSSSSGATSSSRAHDAGPSGDAGDAGDADAATIPVYAVPASWNQTYTRPTDTAAAQDRTSCMFARGAMPAQTTGPTTPIGDSIPIEHIVVLMQENRSFDSYLGHLQAYEAKNGITNTIESAPANASNPDFPKDQAVDGGSAAPDAGLNAWSHAPELCFLDTAHSWGAAHIEYDKGLNDGFFYANNNGGIDGVSTQGIATSQLTGDRALWWYDETDLPFYYSLYSTFAMADHYHSALLGPTYPNRFYLYAATSFGITTNDFPDISAYPTPETPVVIFDELAVRGISFNWYAVDNGIPAVESIFVTSIGSPADPMGRYGRDPTATFEQFLADAKAGTLPAVSFLDGSNENETATGNDEHPPSEIQNGQQFVWQVVNALTTGPLWSSTALFLTYDENGGIYDHVVPPAACEPDSLQPVLTDALDMSQPGAFNQYGFRVPFVVVSPYAKKSYVSHTLYSHTSIDRFIEAKFTLPALTARDANEDPFTDLFDFQNPPYMTPPTFPEPTIDSSAVSACASALPTSN